MSTAYKFRQTVKSRLMEKVYGKQLEYWSTKLIRLSNDNALSQGRTQSSDPFTTYSIWYRGRKWAPEYLDWTDIPESTYCISLLDTYEERMERIADELDDIRTERYESERFLSGLVLFNATPQAYRDILGSTLFKTIETLLPVTHTVDVQQNIIHFKENRLEETENGNHAIKQYARNNIDIVRKMNERLLMNLISQPA